MERFLWCAGMLLGLGGLTSGATAQTINGFRGAYAPTNWTSNPMPGGTAAVDLASSDVDDLHLTYAVDLGSGGVPERSAEFSVPAHANGSVSFTIEYNWHHSFFRDTARIELISEDSAGAPITREIYDVDGGSMSPPISATLVVSDFPIAVGADLTIQVHGSNFDSNSTLNGTLRVHSFVATPDGPCSLATRCNADRGFGTCTNTGVTTYSCACADGFGPTGSGDTLTCSDIDECSDPSRCGTDMGLGACTNTSGGYTCDCAAGAEPSGSGLTANCVDVNECADGTDDCHGDAACANTPGSFTCTCNPGFVGTGRTCVDENECETGTHTCTVFEVCVDEVAAPHSCDCVPGASRPEVDEPCAVICGDGARGPLEECDDGNLNPGDGCDATCVIETGYACAEDGDLLSTCAETCGDGVVDPLEECDDGEDNSDTAPDTCRTNCRNPSCGDGAVDTAETCDNGTENSADEADSCRLDCGPAFCGDGVVDTAESCDPGGEARGALAVSECTSACAPGTDAGTDGGSDAGAGVDADLDETGVAGGGCSATSMRTSFPFALGLWLLLIRRRRL